MPESAPEHPPPSPPTGSDRFFELSIDLMADVGYDGYLKRVNPAWGVTLGWTERELLEVPYAEFLHPDDVQPTLNEAMRLAAEVGQTRNFHTRLRTRQGDYRAVLWNAQADPEREVLWAVGRDLTEHERESEALRASEERLRAITLSLNDAVISADGSGEVVYWSPAAETMFGHSADEMIGRPLTELMPERYRDAHRAGLARVAAGGAPKLVGRGSVELAGLRADGAEFPLELSLGHWEAGGETRYSGVVRDISERVRKDRFVRAQFNVATALAGGGVAAAEEALAGIGEALAWDAAVLWVLDDDRLQRAAAWTGPAGEDLPTGDESLAGEVLEKRRAAVSENRMAFPVRDDGDVLGVVELFSREPRQRDEDLLALVVAVGVQLGQFLVRRRTEADVAAYAAELERSNADLEQFAYVASHDLSEPLRMVSGFVQLLESCYRGRLDADADEFLTFISDGTRRMQNLIGDLLAYSRVGRAELRLEDVALGDLVRRVASDLQREDAIHAGELPVVRGDASQLSQLLQNLIANGLKFTAPQAEARVDVTATRTDEGWLVEVADRGIGIEERHAERIFKVFQRLHGPAQYSGTGIGLAICKAIVERHGGTIGVRPRAEGTGSVFWFVLPETAGA